MDQLMADNREACPGLVWWSVTWSMTSVGDTDHTGADTGHDTTLEQHQTLSDHH